MHARAFVFIDGSNWYHGLMQAGVKHPSNLSYPKICAKLAGPERTWIGTRFYIGRVNQSAPDLYRQQQIFTTSIESSDSRISVHFGRIEKRTSRNPLASELKSYLANLQTRIDSTVYKDLIRLASNHSKVRTAAEKAVDVQIAVDMVVMAERNEYDAAYLLSADGDFTPAVNAVRALNKKVYAVSPRRGVQLAAAVDTFISPKISWFDDCWQ